MLISAYSGYATKNENSSCVATSERKQTKKERKSVVGCYYIIILFFESCDLLITVLITWG